MKKIISAVVASLALLGSAVASASADGVPPSADCKRVATADRTLCHRVELQHPYGRSFDGTRNGALIVPPGKKLVHEITHAGLSKRGMHDGLVQETDAYRFNVTAVPVDTDAIVRTCGNADGAWVVQFIDADGKPGGVQLTYKHVIC